MASLQQPIILEPQSNHKASVIWLHGLGADGHDFEPIAHELRLPSELGVRFIFPHAPIQPVTINKGMSMRAWYDIRDMDLTYQEDEVSIRKSHALILPLIKAELAQGIDYEQLILAGFSQGGAMSLFTGLRMEQPLAGILALSTYLPLPALLAQETTEKAKMIPIMMMHGTYDPVIPLHSAVKSRDMMCEMGYCLDWKEYPMQHSLHPEQIHHIKEWIQRCLS